MTHNRRFQKAGNEFFAIPNMVLFIPYVPEDMTAEFLQAQIEKCEFGDMKTLAFKHKVSSKMARVEFNSWNDTAANRIFQQSATGSSNGRQARLYYTPEEFLLCYEFSDAPIVRERIAFRPFANAGRLPKLEAAAPVFIPQETVSVIAPTIVAPTIVAPTIVAPTVVAPTVVGSIVAPTVVGSIVAPTCPTEEGKEEDKDGNGYVQQEGEQDGNGYVQQEGGCYGEEEVDSECEYGDFAEEWINSDGSGPGHAYIKIPDPSTYISPELLYGQMNLTKMELFSQMKHLEDQEYHFTRLVHEAEEDIRAGTRRIDRQMHNIRVYRSICRKYQEMTHVVQDTKARVLLGLSEYV